MIGARHQPGSHYRRVRDVALEIYTHSAGSDRQAAVDDVETPSALYALAIGEPDRSYYEIAAHGPI
jgi:hypothetical protein